MEPREKQEREQKKKKERTPCEIFSRVVGFLTPLSQWNVGKREEFRQRKTYDKVLREAKASESEKEEAAGETSKVSSGTSAGRSSEASSNSSKE
jgi:hypothetical protein